MNLANLGETERGPRLGRLGSYTHLIALIRLVIRYRSGPAPAPVPVPFPAPSFSSCPNKAPRYTNKVCVPGNEVPITLNWLYNLLHEYNDIQMTQDFTS